MVEIKLESSVRIKNEFKKHLDKVTIYVDDEKYLTNT